MTTAATVDEMTATTAIREGAAIDRGDVATGLQVTVRDRTENDSTAATDGTVRRSLRYPTCFERARRS